MKQIVQIGDTVALATTDFHGWPQLLVEDIYQKQVAKDLTREMALVCWFDKTHNLHRAEFPVELLGVVPCNQ